MSTDTTVYVLVIMEVVSWREIQAPTLEDARSAALSDPDVVRVIRAQYEEPYTEKGT